MVERHHFRCRACSSTSGEELTYIFRLGHNDRSFRMSHCGESQYEGCRIATAWNSKLIPTFEPISFCCTFPQLQKLLQLNNNVHALASWPAPRFLYLSLVTNPHQTSSLGHLGISCQSSIKFR